MKTTQSIRIATAYLLSITLLYSLPGSSSSTPTLPRLTQAFIDTTYSVFIFYE